MVCDIPYKLAKLTAFNAALYLVANLRWTLGAFFTFWIFALTTTLTMSMVFWAIGASLRTQAQALAPATVFILILFIYTGFAISIGYMLSWLHCISYADPILYASESLVVNEPSGQSLPYSALVSRGPGYERVASDSRTCSTIGCAAGLSIVVGDTYAVYEFEFYHSHLRRYVCLFHSILIIFFLSRYRNLGTMFAFIVILFMYLLVSGGHCGCQNSHSSTTQDCLLYIVD